MPNMPRGERGGRLTRRMRALRPRLRWRLPGWALVLLAALMVGVGTVLLPSVVPAGESSKGLVIHVPQPSVALTCAHAAQAPNPIAAENRCPGSAEWRPVESAGPDNAINAFTNPISVNVGGWVRLYVSTTARTYRFAIFRMGWYGGLGGRLMYRSPDIHGINQPDCLFTRATRTVDCANWRAPLTIKVSTWWVSGIYLVKLTSSDHAIRYALFVVRTDASHAPILFQAGVMTYEAYNWWGGYGLYSGLMANGRWSSDIRAYTVSFDRPFSEHAGIGDFSTWDYHTLRWLERNNYNVTYATDVDIASMPALPLRHRLLVISGHDEYWTTAMRQNVTAARDHGTSLAFLGANDVYWHARLGDSPLGHDRLLTCYRRAALDPLGARHPAMATVEWRSSPLNQPEQPLTGVQYASWTLRPAPLVLTASASFLLYATGLRPGAAIPGIMNGEYDRDFAGVRTAPGLRVIGRSPVTCHSNGNCQHGHDIAETTLYQAASGARVFAAGAYDWAWSLDPGSFGARQVATPTAAQSAFQRLNANLLAWLLAAPVPHEARHR